MDSLIERLRRQHAWAFDGAQATSLWLEAANELERLSSIVGEQRGSREEWRAKRQELLDWTGSAWLAGEEVGDDIDAESRSELYTFLCGLIGYFDEGPGE